MLATIESINVTQLRAGDRVMVDTHSTNYLVVLSSIVRTAHTAITYIDITERNRIKEHHIEYGNSVNLDTHRYQA
jgi:hypothetical protein